MKKIVALLMAVCMFALPVLTMAEEAFNADNLIDWFNESGYWMTVANGHWSADPADQITDDELTRAFSMATKQQNAVHWTPWYFVVVKDVEEQRAIMGDYWADRTTEATEGTVTILCLSDQVATMEDGHVTEYNGYYMNTHLAMYDCGMTCGLLEVALASMGYYTHYFGEVYGENAVNDMGKWKSMARYLDGTETRIWGYAGREYPVLGNCVLVAAIVVGKPAADETIETWGTNHIRPDNWKIWDGTVNEAGLPSATVPAEEEAAPAEEEAAPAEEEAETVAVEYELGENQYLGVAEGFVGEIVVRVTMDGDKIANVEILSESESFPGEAYTVIPAAIVEANSVEVDGVSGSTFTSNGVKAAVANALESINK